MVNRFMRLMVFFDLPTATKKERKDYSAFRKFLINNGFTMLQFSVYSRTVRNNDDAAKYRAIIKCNLPPKGSIRVMTVTEKQYDTMDIMLGTRTGEENLLDSKEILEL